MPTLLERFQADRVDSDELEQLLCEVFSGARALSNSEVVYPNHETEYALKLRYQDGVLVEILAGPLLTDEQVNTISQRVERELLASTEVRVGRVFLFFNAPVEGYFHYEDYFQIVPVAPDAPRPQAIVGDHPAVLEFKFRSTPDALIRTVRRAVHERHLELVLNSLLNPGVRTLGHRLRFGWVLPTNDDPSRGRSAFFQTMYTWPGSPPLEDGAFLPTADLSLMTEVDPVEYYGRRGIRPGQIVDVPSSFTDTLRKYFALDRSERDRFLRASFWFQNARTTDSSSAMFTALISAVEALMPSDPGGPSCPECHRSTGPGPTARFATFVDDLAPGIPNQARRRLYSIRSALSHGGSLLPSDRSHLSGAMTQPHLEEWEDILLAEQLVRTTLVNWLRAR